MHDELALCYTERMSIPTTQTAFRIPTLWLTRLDTLAGQMAPQGITISRSAVLKAALERGIVALESEHGEAAEPVEVAKPLAKQPSLFTEPDRKDALNEAHLRARVAKAMAAGHSQTAIARAIKLDPGQLSRWNRGKDPLSAQRLADLAAYLDKLGF